MEEFSKYINVDLSIIQAENIHESKKLLYDRDIDILVGFDIKENDSDAKRSYPYHRIDYYIVSNSRYTNKTQCIKIWRAMIYILLTLQLLQLI